MSFLIGIGLIQIGTVLITAAMYKSIQRILKYFPDGRRLSPMRPRSLLTRESLSPRCDVTALYPLTIGPAPSGPTPVNSSDGVQSAE